MKWGPQATVAIIMALTVFVFTIINSPGVTRLLHIEPRPDPAAAKAWANIMSGIIGALSVFIAGGGMNK